MLPLSTLVLSMLLACGRSDPAPAEPKVKVQERLGQVRPTRADAVATPPAAERVASWEALELSPASKAVSSPIAAPWTPEVEAAYARLAGVVQERGLVDDNAWALGHALLALGPEARVGDRLAADVLVEQAGEWWGEALVRVPKSRDGVPVSPHRDLVLKVLTELGLPPSHTVTLDGRTTTLRALYGASLAGAWWQGDTLGFDSWNDSPWALQALASWASPGMSWTTGPDVSMSVDRLADRVVAQLAEETAFLNDYRASGEPVKKRGQGVFSYTCGGAHLLQGAAHAVGRGFGSTASREEMVRQADLLIWRFDVELAIVERAVQRFPQFALVLYEQRLKFTGHFLESLHKLAIYGLLPPEIDAEAIAARAAKEVAKSVQILEQAQVFDKLDLLKDKQPQVYLDIVGDSAHAMRALNLARGSATVRL